MAEAYSSPGGHISIRHNHAGSLSGEESRRRTPDPVGTARYHRNLVLESQLSHTEISP